MRIGYCSPFNPMKSGVSDFSEELVLELSKHMELVIFSPVKLERDDISEKIETHMLSELDNESLRNSLDLIVYHSGNNKRYHGEIVEMLLKYPGVLEIHDFGMHHLAAERFYLGQGPEAYLQEVQYCHGPHGVRIAQRFLDGLERAPWETHSLDMCMNKRYIDNACAVIVHSEAAKQMTLGIREDMPIVKIMLHTEMEPDHEAWKKECREKLHLPDNRIVSGSFGFATSAKRIIPILDALKLYKENVTSEFTYYIVGEPEKDLMLDEAVRKRGLEENVCVTGFTSLDDFKVYMGACDFCLNLRYPTQGESSASLHRMLGMGKPIVVTDIGTFSDYPDDLTLKVRYDENEVDDIYQALCSLTQKNGIDLNERSQASLSFAKENCDLDANARRYKKFFEEVISHTWKPDYCDIVIGRLCELGLDHPDFTERVGVLMDNLGLL